MKRELESLREYFARVDQQLIEKKGLHVFNTTHELWGCSSLLDCAELFEKINLSNKKGFVDLGSGDGRITLLAAFFTKSLGVEGDKELHEIACKAKEELQKEFPELERCTFICGDYTEMDFSEYDVFYNYIDHSWPEEFEKKLATYSGVLLAYQNVYAPELLEKGRTLWVGQTPIVQYNLKLR